MLNNLPAILTAPAIEPRTYTIGGGSPINNYFPDAHRTFHCLTNLLTEQNWLSFLFDTAPSVWNSLTTRIVNSNSLTTFKSRHTCHFSIRLAHTIDRPMTTFSASKVTTLRRYTRLLLFICHKTHIIIKYTCKNYKIGRTTRHLNCTNSCP